MVQNHMCSNNCAEFLVEKVISALCIAVHNIDADAHSHSHSKSGGTECLARA